MARGGNDHDITRGLGLSRPLETYAPRTQRRYRAAYEQGLTRADITRREREQRSAAPAGLAAAIRRNGMRVANDPDDIRRLVKALGPENARKILSDQLAAVRAMRESGNPTAGRVAQANRGLPIINDDMIDLAPYTYYQVAKG